jgi:hypothetical protein
MERRSDTMPPDTSEAQFAARDWIGAVLGIAAVLAGALVVLAAAYWLLTR